MKRNGINQTHALGNNWNAGMVVASTSAAGNVQNPIQPNESTEDETFWGDDDDDFLMATQITELEKSELWVEPSKAEQERLKEIHEFAQWNHNERSQQRVQEDNDAQLALMKSQMKEMEAHNAQLKIDNYTIQGEASILRRRLEVQAAERRQEVCQKLKGIEELRKRETEEKKKTRMEQEALKTQLQLCRNEIFVLENRNRQLARRESLGKPGAGPTLISPGTSKAQLRLDDSVAAPRSAQFQFPSKKSFMANEVAVPAKIPTKEIEIQTDDLEPEPAAADSQSRVPEDARTLTYEQLKAMTRENAERDFIHLTAVIDEAVMEAPVAFMKEEPSVSVVHGKGIPSVDPVLSIFHYLNVKDQKEWALMSDQQPEFLVRKKKRFDMNHQTLDPVIPKDKPSDEDEDEDSEENEIRKITRREDYEVGDAYVSSEEEDPIEEESDSDPSPSFEYDSPSSSAEDSDYGPEPAESEGSGSIMKPGKGILYPDDPSRPPDPDVLVIPSGSLIDSEQYCNNNELEAPVCPEVAMSCEPVAGPSTRLQAAEPEPAEPPAESKQPQPPAEVQVVGDTSDDVEIIEAGSDESPAREPDPASNPKLKRKKKVRVKSLAGCINLSIRESLMNGGFFVTLKMVRTDLRTLLDEVEHSRKSGALFLQNNRLRNFVSLLVWAKNLWAGVSYEEDLPQVSKEWKRSDWRRELEEWTEILIEAIWRPFSILQEMELKVRLLFLDTMRTIHRMGYFKHTEKNYDQLFVTLYDSVSIPENNCYANLLSILGILKWTSKSKTTYKYLCRSTTDDSKCMSTFLAQRTIEVFHSTKRRLKRLAIFDHFYYFLETLNEPESAHQSVIRGEEAEATSPKPKLRVKKRRTEPVSFRREFKELEPDAVWSDEEEEAMNDSENEEGAGGGLTFVPSPFRAEIGGASWLRTTTWYDPTGTHCQCRKHLVKAFVSLLREIWTLWGQSDNPLIGKRAPIQALDLEDEHLSNQDILAWNLETEFDMTGNPSNEFTGALSRSFKLMQSIYDHTENIAAVLGTDGYCTFWEVMGYYQFHVERVCPDQKLMVEYITYDPEDDQSDAEVDTWGDEEFEYLKRKYDVEEGEAGNTDPDALQEKAASQPFSDSEFDSS